MGCSPANLRSLVRLHPFDVPPASATIGEIRGVVKLLTTSLREKK